MHESLIKNRILPGRERIEKRRSTIFAPYYWLVIMRIFAVPRTYNASSFLSPPFKIVYTYQYDDRKQRTKLQRDSRRSRTLIGKVEKVVDAIIQYYMLLYQEEILIMQGYGLLILSDTEYSVSTASNLNDSNILTNLNSWKN